MTLVQKWHDINNKEFERKEVLFVQKTALIDETDVQFAEISSNSPSIAPRIRIVFTHRGAEHMGTVTGDNIGKRLAFVFDGKIYSAPTIRTRITREAEIAGSFDLQEGKELVAKINKSHEPTSQP
jgi:preprotein translocase subunit SecD